MRRSDNTGTLEAPPLPSPHTAILHRSASSVSKSRYTIPHKVVILSAALAIFFLGMTATAHLCFREGTADLMGFSALFDVTAEGNLPTWFASALLQLTALIAWMIGDACGGDKKWWRGIAILLFLMGIDEVASLHNAPSRRLREVLGVHGGLLMNAWVIPGAILCLSVAATYLKFLLRQPRWLAKGFVVAAGLYVFGALGLEMVGSTLEYDAGGLNYDGESSYSLPYEMVAVAEELFEYAGVICTLAILLRYASKLDAEVTIAAPAS